MLLDVRNLTTTFRSRRGVVRAVDDVSFTIEPEQTLGLVGESGCGKSVTALSIMGLLPSPPGAIETGSIELRTAGGVVDLADLDPRGAQMRRIRGNDVAMVFQEPMTSLNPVFPVGFQIAEAIRVHRDVSKRDADAEVVRLLAEVGIPAPDQTRRRFPHQLSGGMRQRVMIAMALSCDPALLIADEPTTALDVTIQAQVLTLMNRARAAYNASILFITHDLGVIARMADTVAVMYLGRIVEYAPINELFSRPLHPYTKGLLESVPSLVQPRTRRLTPIRGSVPEPGTRHDGCVFADRCPAAMDRCRTSAPALVDYGGTHRAACFLHGDAEAAAGDRELARG